MRCAGRLVDPGATKSEVLARCGPPGFTSLIAVEIRHQGGTATEEVPVEQWSYDQGTDTLRRILTFRAGRLVSIEKGERISSSKIKGTFSARVGDSQAEIYRKYGEPLLRETVRVEKVPVASDADSEVEIVREVPVEEWTYSPGSDTFLKILTFKDGRLVRIEDGERQ
jgi:hypothetical protein